MTGLSADRADGSSSSAATPRDAFLRATGIAVAAVGVMALVALVKSGGFGFQDLAVYVLVNAVFVLLVGFAGLLLARRAERPQARWSVGLRLVGGVLIGVVCTFVAALFFGPSIGAASLPVFPAWVAGGALGLALSQRRLAGSALAESAIVLAILLAVALLADPLVARLRGDQQLELVWLWLQPTQDGLTVVHEEGRVSLDEGGEALLRDAGVRGEVRVLGRSRDGTGPAVTAYVVLTHPVAQPTRLRQPDGTDAVYLQEDDRFRLYPLHTETRNRVIEIVPAQRPDQLDFWVETAGGRTGGHVTWSRITTTDSTSR